MELPLASNQNRAIYIAAVNAVLRYLGMVEGTLYCSGDGPERCAEEISPRICSEHGLVSVGLVGLNPAIAEALAEPSVLRG